MQSEYKNQLKFSRAGSIDNETEPKRSLLPYLTSDSSIGQEIRYFSTDWKQSQLKAKATSGQSLANTSKQVVANDFCELNFKPKTSGTLITNIEIPVNTVQSSTGYLILKEKNNGNENNI